MTNIFSYDIGKSTMFVFDSSKPIVIRKKGEKKDARIYNPHEYSKEDFLNLNIIPEPDSGTYFLVQNKF